MFQLPTVDGKSQLQHAGYPVADNVDAVDSFTTLTGGGVATVFQREGDEFRRITTSLKKEDGSRAINTLLDRNHPAYKLMIEGKRYLGRAVLFGKTYMTMYEPIVQADKVIGILFIGQDMGQQLAAMKHAFELASSPTLATAAVDVRDGPALGQLTGHIDGKLDAADPLLQALRDAVKAGETKGAFAHLDFPKGLAGSGATNTAWSYFAPWGWAIVQAERDSDTTAGARSELTLLWTIIAVGSS
jgi:methyl-accepting chemotaxis protein-2 (aspartate sensor receptor)